MTVSNGEVHHDQGDSDSSISESDSEYEVSKQYDTSAEHGGHKDTKKKGNFQESTYSRRKSRLQRKDTNHYYRLISILYILSCARGAGSP